MNQKPVGARGAMAYPCAHLMAQQPQNKLLRILVPITLIILAAGFFTYSIWQAQQRRAAAPPPAAQAPAPPAAAPPTTPAQPVPGEQPAAVGVEAPPAAAPVLPPPTGPAAPLVQFENLRVETFPVGPQGVTYSPIGSLDPNGDITMRVDFNPLGAGVSAITLARHYETVERLDQVVVQHEHIYTPPPTTADPEPQPILVVPYSALGIEINGQMISLIGTPVAPGRLSPDIWREVQPGQFEAFILSGDTRIARLIRQFEVEPESYVLNLRQRVQNLTDQPLSIRWQQFGPIDLDRDVVAYGGDRRRVRFGYLHAPNIQRGDPTVASNDFVWERSPQMCIFFWARDRLLGPRSPDTGIYETIRTIWPNDRSRDRNYRLVWTGMTNRYFGAALHPLLAQEVHPDNKVFAAAAFVDRIILHRYVTVGGRTDYDPVLILRTTSGATPVAPRTTASMDMAVYAGPLSRGLIDQHPSAAIAGLRGLVVYNFGGPCAPCTFGFLTSGLLYLLLFLHDYIVFDWALAIVVLVLIVRTLLHPVTKWSQIRLQRFGKQMSDMAPKQKKLQEKYKDDPKRMTEEMRKLWREEGINPAGMLGCVPLLLQTPIWIALFAMLFFAFELRHQPALFGVFQLVSGGNWRFLADLAEPDRFIYFHRVLFSLPLLGEIRSFNLLPILLGIVFFVQQKYLTPPTTVPLSPEQQQQQKMIKIMMVVLFPVFMYNAPSGLALYFIVNSSLAILESKWIRRHIEKHKLLEVKKGPPKAGGFMARLQQLAEERQRQMSGGNKNQQPRKKN